MILSKIHCKNINLLEPIPAMPQKMLTDFLGYTCQPKPGSSKNFLYDSNIGEAKFVDSHTQGYSFVRAADCLRLWCKTEQVHHTDCLIYEQTKQSVVPLLKSHLQKAIRRHNTASALSTAYSMILYDRSALLRRLPIIAIEDVDLIPGTAIIVWLMMAGESYKWSEQDIRNVLGYVLRLCQTSAYLVRTGSEVSMSHSVLSTIQQPMRDELLALFYRIKWGGTDGDMKMLNDAIQTYYTKNLVFRCGPQIYEGPMPEPLELNLDNPYFLLDAIDFHCFPRMIKRISSITCVPNQRVKELIWICHSALNLRKPHVMRRAEELRKTRDYRRIKDSIDQVRTSLFEELINETQCFIECV